MAGETLRVMSVFCCCYVGGGGCSGDSTRSRGGGGDFILQCMHFFYKVANQNLQAIKGSFVFFYSHNIFSVPLAKTSHLTSACALRPLEANEMSV